MVKIVDNFLSEQEVMKLKSVVYDKLFAWYWFDDVSYHKDHPHYNYVNNNLFYMCHILYEAPAYFTKQYQPIAEVFENKFDLKCVLRVKANCYPKSDKVEEHGMHQDYTYKHNGVLNSLNTCDGYTKFESGEKIDSVKNRAIFFDPSVPHTSTNTTNAKRRVNININYF